MNPKENTAKEKKQLEQQQQQGINVRNLRQIQTYNQKHEHVNHERIVTVNIRSIKDKEDLLRNAINDLKIDMMIVTKTWLHNTHEDTMWVQGNELNKNGLQIYRCNWQNRKGGGIALITSSSFKVNTQNNKLQ